MPYDFRTRIADGGKSIGGYELNRVSSIRVDLGALKHNVAQIKKKVTAGTQFMAVVKADAYGHGAVKVALAALDAGATWLGVSRPSEAVKLRQGGITAPILLLQPVDNADSAGQMCQMDVACAAGSIEHLKSLTAGGMIAGKKMRIHLKVDSGMHRFGFLPHQLADALDWFSPHAPVEIEGVFTHFAVAEDDKAYTLKQNDILLDAMRTVCMAGHRPMMHAANTAATLNFPQTHHDMVRVGLAMYGYSSIEKKMDLKPVLSWRAPINQIIDLQVGEGVSYGLRFVANRPTRIASIGAGYGDGYARELSDKGGHVLIAGQRAPIVGRICMDLMLADVTDIPSAAEGMDAYLLGGGANGVTADEMAHWRNTIAYEILCGITERVDHEYV